MQGARLSPDGNKIVARLARGGTDYLAWLDLSKPGSKPVLIAAAGEYKGIGDRTVKSFRFVGNDNIVFELWSRELVYGQRIDVTRLVAYNLASTKLTPLGWEGAFGQAANILHIDHDRSKITFERESERYGTERWQLPEVIRVDVTNGDIETLVRPNPIVQQWFADGKGVVRGGIGYDRDNGKVRILYRSGPDGNFETVYNQADRDHTDSTIVPMMFLDEPDMAIVRSNKDGYQKLYKANLRTLELGQPIFERPGHDVGDVIEDDNGAKMIGVSVTEDGPRTIWLDRDLSEIQSYLDEALGKGAATIVSASRDYRKLLVHAGMPNQAGAYFYYDVTSGRFARLGWRDELLQDRRLNPVSTIRYRASDGETISAVLTMPRHRSGRNLPLVVMPHGGPFGVRDAEEYDHWPQAMAELGYVVVQPNYRGSGGYGREWVLKGRNSGFGLRMQDDLNDAVTHLASQGIVDPKRVCMMGWSYGGYASARAAQRDADKYRCAIAGAGVYDLTTMRIYDKGYLGAFGAKYLTAGTADLDSVSPAANTSGRWAPIMIVHGTRDMRVPISQAKLLVSRLKGSGKRQGEDFDFLEQPKNTHNLPYNEDRVGWLVAAERWLERFNPAYIESDTDKPVPVRISLAAARPAATN
jgi:acetyl esterase/lipase